MRRERGVQVKSGAYAAQITPAVIAVLKGGEWGRRRGVAKSALSGKPQQWRSFRIEQPQQ